MSNKKGKKEEKPWKIPPYDRRRGNQLRKMEEAKKEEKEEEQKQEQKQEGD